MKKLFDFHRASWRLLATLLAVLGFAGVTTVVTTSAAQASDLGGPIARSEVIWRAQYWVDHQPGPYNQGAFSPGPGGDKSYRRDCSGYVSMAWHLNDNPWTGSLAGYAHEISRGDLKPGDIMLFAGTHTFLFDHWTDNNGNFVYYSFGSTPVKHRSANIGSASLDGHPNGSYRAYRYNKIIDDLPGKKKFVDMDFSGDGSADLLSTTASGELRYFPNNGASNAGGNPFNQYQVTGSGWETATRVLEGDISGDGSMDLLSTTASGELRYFPNNGSSNAGGNPFNEYIVTGSGWGPEVTRMFLADFSGDGSADLLATKKDGTLLWCPNNRATNPGGAPFMTCSVTGSGWNTATRMFVADFSGDGSADLLATTESGELRYFPNNRSTNAGGNPFNEYQVTGSGWNSANRMFVADFSGDGSADLLSTTASGELRYFPNNGSTNAGHNPFNDYIVTGSGWNTANRMFVADFSGDGSADLLSTTASGELRYFPNNRATNPGGAPFNTYQVTGSGWNTANRIITNTTEQPTLGESSRR